MAGFVICADWLAPGVWCCKRVNIEFWKWMKLDYDFWHRTRLQLSSKCLRLFNLLHVYINLTINLINLTREAITVETTMPFQILRLSQGTFWSFWNMVCNLACSLSHILPIPWCTGDIIEKKSILKFQRNQELSILSLNGAFYFLSLFDRKGTPGFLILAIHKWYSFHLSGLERCSPSNCYKFTAF